MSTFLFFTAIFLLVAASILLETDASPPPKTNTKLEKGPSSSDNAESTPGLTPEKPWAARLKDHTHEDPTLIETDGLIAQSTGKKNGFRSVRAELPIPKSGIFYYEVKILEKKSGIFIGLGTKDMPLDKCVGQSVGTYAYSNIGTFWGHEVEKRSKINNGRPYIRGNPKFEEGNVIGCGVDWAKRQIIYTLNGVRLETAGLLLDSAPDLFPCVSLNDPDNKIEANFGTKKFEFDIAKAFFNASPPPKTNTKLEKGPFSSNNAESTPGLTPKNRWAAPDKKVAHIEPEATPEKKLESRTLYTVDPIKKSGIYYYEVKVKERKVKEVNEAKEELKKGSVSIGLGPKERVVGDYEGFAYDSCGIFAGYKTPGCPQSRDRRFYDAPKFGARDVVGCGVDFATGQIFYTKNGQRFDPVGEFVDSAAELFPRVSLTHPDVDIEENFGPVFAYKF